MTEGVGPDMDETHGGQGGPGAGLVMRHLAVSLVMAGILATVFTAWTPATLAPGELAGQLASALEPGGEPTPLPLANPDASDGQGLRVGIVAGHSGVDPDLGFEDPGAVCPDGLTEVQVNEEIAARVVRGLTAAGLQADLLEEFDERLVGYRAVALVSIHADSCLPINDEATGFKVSAAQDTAVPDKAQRLVACLADRYAAATGLRYHRFSITRDMTEYHSFYEINSQTPAVVIETGFLHLDRDFLTERPAEAARGIVEGVLCYVNNEPIELPGG